MSYRLGHRSRLPYNMAESYDIVEYIDDEFIKIALKRLEILYLNNVLCDVTIKVGCQQFPAHKNILAASSGYFLDLFEVNRKWGHEEKLGSTNEVNIDDITAETMGLVLRYIYSGEIQLRISNVESVLHCAQKFQLHSLMKACCRYFVNTLDIRNCLNVLSYSTTYNYGHLERVVFQFVQLNFLQLTTVTEFLDASADQMSSLLSSDDLNIASEEDAYEALIRWTKHDLENRRDQFQQLFKLVRLPLLSPYFVVDVVEEEELVKTTPSCQALLRTTYLYHLLPSRRTQTGYPSNKPRKHLRWIENLVAIGGGSAFSYDISAEKWDEIQNVPRATTYHGLVCLGKDIYIVGGFTNSSEILNSIARYDAAEGLWVDMPPLNFRRCKTAVAEVDGYIYVIGGYDGFATMNSVERFGSNSELRENLEPMPSRRSCTCAVSYLGFIHVIGGHNGANILNTIESYDTSRNTWSSIQIQPMRERRSFPSAAVCRDRMLVVGGYDGHETLRAVEEYNFTSLQWRQAAPMIVARSNAGSAVWNDKLYVVGGWDGRVLDAVECFDVIKDEWQLLKALPRPTTGVRCCFLSSKPLSDAVGDSNVVSNRNLSDNPEFYGKTISRRVLCAAVFVAGLLSGYAIKKWQLFYST